MKQVEIYVNECIRLLPKNQQKDVQAELTSDILEQVNEKIEMGVKEEDAVVFVLEQLGDPVALADAYNNKQHYLIGPRYYNVYMKTLKMVLFGVAIGLLVAHAIRLYVTPLQDVDVISVVVDLLASVVNAGFQVFAWVTLVFVIIERNEKQPIVATQSSESWTIKQLPKTMSSAKISKGESWFTIVVYAIALFIINFDSSVIQIIFFKDNNIQSLIPILNETNKSEWIFGLSFVFVLIISIHLIRIASVNLTKKRELFIIALRVVALGLFVWVVVSQSLINPELAQAIAPNNDGFALWLNQSLAITLGVLIFVNVFTILHNLYKLLKL